MEQKEIVEELRKILGNSETLYADMCDFVDELEEELE